MKGFDPLQMLTSVCVCIYIYIYIYMYICIHIYNHPSAVNR